MTEITPAQNLDELWDIFDPANTVNPESNLYIQRAEDGLKKLTFDLKRNKQAFQSFLCGHVGSGKTTELLRLSQDPALNQKYLPIYISVNDFKRLSTAYSRPSH